MSIVRPMMRSLMRVGKLTPGGGAAYDVHPNLVLDMPFAANLRDYISGQYLTLNRAGELVYLGKDGTYKTAPADHPAIGKYGIFTDGASTNSLLNNRDLSKGDWNDDLSSKAQDQIGIDGQENKAWTITDDSDSIVRNINQRVSIPDDSEIHTISVYIKKNNNESRFPGIQMRVVGGTDELREGITLNTKTGEVYEHNDHGSYTVFDIGHWWRVVLTLSNNNTGNTTLASRIYPALTETFDTIEGSATGSIVIDFPQVELNRSYASSPIETGDSPVSRATQAADASDNGLFVSLSDLNSRLETALASEGAAILQLRPEFDYGVDTSDAGLISFNDSVNDFLFYNNGVLKFTDGTNTAIYTQEWSKGDQFWPVAKWGGGELVVGVYDGSSITWGTAQSFEGSFPKNTDLRPFFDNELPQFSGELKFFDKVINDDVLVREANK